LVCKRWSFLASNNFIWKDFCCPHWEDAEHPVSSWKEEYLQWLRRMARRLNETNEQNKKNLEKLVENKSNNFSHIRFFWPSYAAFRENYKFQIVVLGDAGVGKSNLLLRYAEDKFSNTHIKSEIKLRTLELHGSCIELQMLDSGYEEFKDPTTATGCLVSAHACLLCFDVTDLSSFESVTKKWLPKVEKYRKNGLHVCLVGTKADIEKRAVSYETAKNLALSFGVPYFETSSKRNSGVNECFTQCASNVFKILAWPNYVPQEIVFRTMVGLPEVDWVVKGGKAKPSRSTSSTTSLLTKIRRRLSSNQGLTL